MRTWSHARGYLLLATLGIVGFLLVSSVAKSLLKKEGPGVSAPVAPAVSDTIKAEEPKVIPDAKPGQSRPPEGIM